MPDTALSANTLTLIRHIFCSEQQAGVAALLAARCGSTLPFMDKATPEALERIRYAVLKLSGGSLPELERAVSLANTDWRDVLVGAGFATSLLAHQQWFDERCK